jgi:cation:H+ antiporter
MLISIGLVILGILFLLLGGEILLRGAVGLATLLRLTPAVIGLTVVAAGTSVPELAVSGIAACSGKTEIAVANVIGSNIFNIAVIIGLCAIIRPMAITGNTIKLEYPILLLVSLLCLVMCHDGQINRLDAGLCLSIYVAFTVYVVNLVRKQVTATEKKQFKAEVEELEPTEKRPNVWLCLMLVTGGILLLAGGAQATVEGASRLARMLGWSETVIGLTIVSAGTGLPEVVASLVSSIRGRSDMAIGNAIGSNLFNILCVLGLSALVSPLPVPPQIITSDCWWMLGATILLLPLMFTGRKINRWEGVALLTLYCFYIGLLLNSQH